MNVQNYNVNNLAHNKTSFGYGKLDIDPAISRDVIREIKEHEQKLTKLVSGESDIFFLKGEADKVNVLIIPDLNSMENGVHSGFVEANPISDNWIVNAIKTALQKCKSMN